MVMQRTFHCIYEHYEKWDQVFWNSVYNDFVCWTQVNYEGGPIWGRKHTTEEKGSIFSFYCLNFILSSFICFHLMETIISANETFDLASGSCFLVNATRVSSIYFGIIGRQQAGVTYSSLLYPLSCSNPFSVTWNTYYTILFFCLHLLYELLVTNLCQEKI